MMNITLKATTFQLLIFSVFSTRNMSTDTSPPLTVPVVDEAIEKIAADQDVSTFFHILRGCVDSGECKANASETKWTLFTVEDQTFATNRPMDVADPLIGDPETQKILIAAQLSNGKVNKDDDKISGDGLKVTMLNGKEITVTKKDGKLMANDMPITKAFDYEHGTVFVMEYFLFFTQDHISDGIRRIHKKEGVVHTPWGSHPYVEKDS